MSRFVYADIAAKYGYRMCPGGCWLKAQTHEVGASHDEVVHWRNRQWNHYGLWRSLKLLSKSHRASNSAAEEIDELMLAQLRSRELGVRIPKEVVDADRRRLRWRLHQNPETLSREQGRWIDQ